MATLKSGDSTRTDSTNDANAGPVKIGVYDRDGSSGAGSTLAARPGRSGVKIAVALIAVVIAIILAMALL